MKITIRKNVFETNSSSTHSICITKTTTRPNDFILFTIGEFGWEFNKYYSTEEKACYLYTGILTAFEEQVTNEYLNKLKTLLDENNIEYEFEEPIYHHFEYEEKQYVSLENGYIDHANELDSFIDTVLSSSERLINYLFSKESFVLTGNDNCDCNVNIQVGYEHEEYYKGN